MTRFYEEDKLQIYVVDWLKNACPHLLFTHAANQGRSPQEGAKLKKMGVLAGTPDLLFWHDGWHGAIELKVATGLSDAQRAFRDRFIATGGKYAVCHSVMAVRDTLISWGIKPLAAILKEPPPPKSVQFKMGVDFFRP